MANLTKSWGPIPSILVKGWLVESCLIGLRTVLFQIFWEILFHTKWDWTHRRWEWNEYWKTQKTQNSSLTTDDLWWPSLISYHLVSHLWWQPLPEITKMTLTTDRVNIETCNKNQTPLSLGQSSTETCCQPSWMAAITWIHKSGCHHSESQQRYLQQKLNATKSGSVFNFNMLSAI